MDSRRMGDVIIRHFIHTNDIRNIEDEYHAETLFKLEIGSTGFFLESKHFYKDSVDYPEYYKPFYKGIYLRPLEPLTNRDSKVGATFYQEIYGTTLSFYQQLISIAGLAII
jgi:hypothetical protein